MATFKIFNPDWLNEDFFKSIGYVLEKDDGKCAVYQSTNKHLKHIIKGFNQPCGYTQRTISFNREYHNEKEDNPYIYLGIRDDGNTRYVFNGIIQTKEDLLTIIRLID